MYEIIVYDKNKSYMLVGESKDLKDYPTIPVGAHAFILDNLTVFHKRGPDENIQVDAENPPETPDEEPEVNTTSELGAAVIGEMNIGE